MAETSAGPVSASVTVSQPTASDAVSVWGGLLFAVGVGLLVGALAHDALAGIGAGIALGGALAMVGGVVQSWLGR